MTPTCFRISKRYIILFAYLFCRTVNWIWGLVHARRALYYWPISSHTLRCHPFWDRISVSYPSWHWVCHLSVSALQVAGTTELCTRPRRILEDTRESGSNIQRYCVISMVPHIYNPSTGEAEAGELLSSRPATATHREDSCLKNQKWRRATTTKSRSVSKCG